VTVELVTDADAALHAEVHRVLAAVTTLEGAVGWLHVPDEAEAAGWFDAEVRLAAAGRGGVAVVRLHGRVAALGVWARFSAPVVAQNAEVRKVMTHPDARGHGLGRVVVRALEEDARRAGVEVLLLDVRGNNHGAIALYSSLGWQEYGRIPDFIAVGSDRWDRCCFYRELDRPAGLRLRGSEPGGPGSSSRRGST
jgi:ribosomal protein S18 acetylase RimI-like enzyme